MSKFKKKKELFVIKGKAVVDELCYCGHLRSEHDDLFSGIPQAIGKGSCKRCSCERFTWKGFIFENKEQGE